MNLVNQVVIYRPKFREAQQAKILKVEGDYIYIDVLEKPMPFPEAFQEFLELSDKTLQVEVKKLIAEKNERIKQEIKVIRVRRLREMEIAKRFEEEKKKRGEAAQTRSIPTAKKRYHQKRESEKIVKNAVTHKNYSIIREVENTLRSVRPNYEDEITDINRILKTLENKNSLGLNDHVKAMVLSLLSNMRDWKPIEENLSLLETIFCGYDAEKLSEKSGEILVEEVKRKKCGNLKINSQMTHLKENIAILKTLSQKTGGIDSFYASTDKYELVAMLCDMNSEYKLHEMGVALVCEYLKGVGIPLVKPDRHVCRIIGRLGFSETIPAGEIETLRICDEIANALNMSHAQVDTILWQYGVKEKCGICADEPDCIRCGVASCPNRRQEQ